MRSGVVGSCDVIVLIGFWSCERIENVFVSLDVCVSGCWMVIEWCN